MTIKDARKIIARIEANLYELNEYVYHDAILPKVAAKDIIGLLRDYINLIDIQPVNLPKECVGG